jgi:hypothetical protein
VTLHIYSRCNLFEVQPEFERILRFGTMNNDILNNSIMVTWESLDELHNIYSGSTVSPTIDMDRLGRAYIKRDTGWPIGLSFGPAAHLNLRSATSPYDSPF